jgi:hypothetical protein
MNRARYAADALVSAPASMCAHLNGSMTRLLWAGWLVANEKFQDWEAQQDAATTGIPDAE